VSSHSSVATLQTAVHLLLTYSCRHYTVAAGVIWLDGSRGLGDLERSLAWKSSKPFADKSQCEKEELYERIAEQLAAIADKLNLESPRSVKSSSQSGPEDEKAADLPGIGL